MAIAGSAAPWVPKRNKYRNIPTEYNGRTYTSKLEASHAAALDLQKRAGLIRGWLPQVSLPIHAGSQTRIIVDFLVVRNDGSIALQDTKGAEPTAAWKIKRKELEAALGIPIDIVRRTRT